MRGSLLYRWSPLTNELINPIARGWDENTSHRKNPIDNITVYVCVYVCQDPSDLPPLSTMCTDTTADNRVISKHAG